MVLRAARVALVLLLTTAARGEGCTSPGLTVPSSSAYVKMSADPESCLSLHNNACPSAAGITAPVIFLDSFLLMGFPTRPLDRVYLTPDGRHLTDSARAKFCDASVYSKDWNLPVSGKWVYQSSFHQMFCELGYSVDLSLTVAEQDSIAQGPYGGRGAHLRSLEAAGAVGVTSFIRNFTLLERTEADTCYDVSRMAVTYTNLSHYHIGKSAWNSKLLAPLAAKNNGRSYTIRIPSAPAPSPPPPPLTPPSADAGTIAAIGGAALGGVVLLALVIYILVRRQKGGAKSPGGGKGMPPQAKPQHKTELTV